MGFSKGLHLDLAGAAELIERVSCRDSVSGACEAAGSSGFAHARKRCNPDEIASVWMSRVAKAAMTFSCTWTEPR